MITAHNQWLLMVRSIPYWTTSVFSYNVTDLVLIYESLTSSAFVVRRLTLNSLTNAERRPTAHSLGWTEPFYNFGRTENISPCLTVPLLFCVQPLPRERAHWSAAQQWTSACVRCCGKVCLASIWLAMNFRSGSTIPAFRRHIKIRINLSWNTKLFILNLISIMHCAVRRCRTVVQ
jgi:hypothetical protein